MAEPPNASESPLPLAGVRVLDVSQVMAGPFCSMLLGDMGADVIKIEPPDGGDQTRRAMGFKLKGNDSLGFFNLNRNKRSLVLDLKNKAARAVFYRLVETSDMLVENYRPGVTKRLGIDYPTLNAINPRLIYASISGFGQTGPWSQRPGFDLIAQAMAGVMSITGQPDGPPTKSGVPVSDIGCALFALYGIMAAFIGREKTGRGQKVNGPSRTLEVVEEIIQNGPKPDGRLAALLQLLRDASQNSIGRSAAQHRPMFHVIALSASVLRLTPPENHGFSSQHRM